MNLSHLLAAIHHDHGVGVAPLSGWPPQPGKHELLVETLVDKAEALSGYAPSEADALAFLQTLRPIGPASIAKPQKNFATAATPEALVSASPNKKKSAANLEVIYRIHGYERRARNASVALTDVLTALAKNEPDKLAKLSDAVRTAKRNHIAQCPEEINPARPDLARAAMIATGWFVGLNIANRDKMMIIRAACKIYGLSMPGDLSIDLRNA